MVIKRDLLKKENKSFFKIIIGILFFASTIAYGFGKYMLSHTIVTYDWFLIVFMVLIGVIFTIEGAGFSLSKLLGKAFINIDEYTIEIKTDIFAKKQKVCWHEIESVEYKAKEINIMKTDGSSLVLDLSQFDPSLIKEAKKSIKSIASKITNDRYVHTN